MVIAFLVMIVGTGIMLTVAAVVLQGHRSVRFDRDHTRVVHGADVGVHEVLHRLNLPSGHASRITVATNSAGYPGWLQDLPPYRYRWTAAPSGTSPGTWVVEGNGLLNGVQRDVTAWVQQPRLFRRAAFADDHLTFVGSNSADSFTGNVWGTGEGDIGTNGAITLNGNTTADGAAVYNWASDPTAARCTSNGNTVCSGVETVDSELDVASDNALAFVGEAIAQNCPTTPTAYIASTHGALAPGIHCFTTMTFDTSVTFSASSANPVIVYLTNPTTNTTLSTTHRLTINCAGCSGTGGASPDSGALRIFTASYGDVRIGNHSHIAAALYAPRASCRGNPSNAQTHFYGSMVCGRITNQGGWKFHYDTRLRDIGLGGFNIIRWAER